jgi:hypothetical protein
MSQRRLVYSKHSRLRLVSNVSNISNACNVSNVCNVSIVCNVSNVSNVLIGFFSFLFLLRPLTVVMKQTRKVVHAIELSILLRCLWVKHCCQPTYLVSQVEELTSPQSPANISFLFHCKMKSLLLI